MSDNTNRFESAISMITQTLMQSVKSERQSTYESTTEKAITHQRIETPLSVGVGLYLYNATRSRKLIKFFSDLNIGITYDKVTSIKKEIASSIIRKSKEQNDVYIPSKLSENHPVFFAVDNTDLKIDTFDGKDQLHGTAIAVYQTPNTENEQVTSPFEISRGQKTAVDLAWNRNVALCNEPPKIICSYCDYNTDTSTDLLEYYKRWDIIWSIMKDANVNIPTWAAYNSLITNRRNITTVQQLPILNGSPTCWPNIYQAMKDSNELRKALGSDSKTVISFDMQLYAKAIRLQVKSDVRDNYVFRIGELHVVFTVLKVLGKLIDGSGFDQLFEEAGIYGNTVIGQIKEGKHLYRGMEAHFTLYLALFKLYLDAFFKAHPDLANEIKLTIKLNTQIFDNTTKRDVLENHKLFDDLLVKLEVEEKMKDFDKCLKFQNKFYKNYMTLFETLISFVRASRQQLWELHLQSLNALCPYFFVFDMLNYARMTPVYLSQMYQLRREDPVVWSNLENGGFCVNKSTVPFSAIGADHALEQENRSVKVLGGIKGIANNQKLLDEYFLTTAEISNIVEQFCKDFMLDDNDARKVEHHYQFIGSHNTRLNDHVAKILYVFETQDISFEESKEVYNVMTKKVLPADAAKKFLSMGDIGTSKYKNFIEENLVGNKSIWDEMKKENLPTFSKNCIQTKVNISKQLVNIKEERKLMSRFVIAARTRTEIDLPVYFGTYKSSVVPKSLFATDGSILLCADKAKIAQELLLLQRSECNTDNELEASNAQSESNNGKSNIYDEPAKNTDICPLISNHLNTAAAESNEVNTRKAIIFDGMAVVNKVDIKKEKIKTCQEFSSSFFSKIRRESSNYNELRIIFDRYTTSSLKSSMRAKRTKGVNVRYKVADETIIEHITTKQFLSNLETKNDLTAYLASKADNELNFIDYVVVYGNTCLTNIMDLKKTLFTYTHEEADTGIVLHALDISERNPFTELVVSCTDTDVLLILLFYYENLCSNCTFKTNNNEFKLQIIYENLGTECCKALLGFHSFSGCDQSSKFNGHSKLSCWKTFIKSDSTTLKAFQELGDKSSFSISVYDGLEKFVMDLYCPKRPISVTNIGELRWFMFSKFQCESEKLPPTKSALCEKILRSHYITLTWRSSHLPEPDMPDPIGFGWKWNEPEKTYDAIMTTRLPAPVSVIELCRCKCKTGCINQRCLCHKSKLKCTEMCFCINCSNNEVDNDDESDQENVNSDDD